MWILCYCKLKIEAMAPKECFLSLVMGDLCLLLLWTVGG